MLFHFFKVRLTSRKVFDFMKFLFDCSFLFLRTVFVNDVFRMNEFLSH